MYGLTIDITGSAQAALGDLADKLTSASVRSAAGGAVKRLLQDHFGTLDSSRTNKLGGKRTHYFADAARSISYETDDDGVTVSIHQLGIGLHYFGGEVKPINKKYLTIPARAEAHGRRAGEFDNLKVLFGRNGPYALAERYHQEVNFTKDRRKGHKGEHQLKSVGATVRGGGVFFWLVKSATIEADEDILPNEDLMTETAIEAMADQLGVS